ncbi:DUF4430 domain-containing protein [Crassaminicella profunda]|uniref:DUF4430 domain-containing protein n=1 Tax=Crassaminicella profunda TaxID=1286698 RepID=UPI001CA752A5|nr:DUF4430 domain-containing protein [Crassaminicella profunda]QZY55694.1 DUF4430 domain-containing protein [Crassaminicella profunda]
MKKVFSLMLVLTLVLGLAGVQAFAAGGIEDITFNDANKFTIGTEVGELIEYTVKGLEVNDGSYTKVEISDPQNIHWTTSNAAVVDFDGSASGAAVTVEAIEEGTATITATYNGMSVESHVTVSPKSSTATVKNVNMKVIFPGKDKLQNPSQVSDNELLDSIDVTIPELTNFSLKDIYGSSYNDSAVMQDKVTAMHAFLYALEEKCDPEGHTDGWDWVRENVTVGYSGNFVSKVGVYENFGMTGWMYKVNNVLPMVGAAQYELKNGDQEKWGFATWGEEW